MKRNFDKEKAKKSFENITGLPVTSDESSGEGQTFTSTVYSEKPLWEGGKSSEKKTISSTPESEKKRLDEELKRKKEIEEINRQRSKRNKDWKTYTLYERWDEEDVGVEVQTTATGDFELNQPENSSASITDLTEEEARKFENEGVEVVRSSDSIKEKKEKVGKDVNSACEVSHKTQNQWGNKLSFIALGLFGLVGIITTVVVKNKN